MEEGIKRIVDANINRVTEGLRVVEDVYRYYYDHPGIQQRLKAMRHQVADALGGLDTISGRRAVSDVGFASHGVLEFKRQGTDDICRANIKRVQEGLRVLEEVFKLDNAGRSAAMKELRYGVYELQSDLFTAPKLLPRGLYLVMTDPLAGYEELAGMAVKAGIPALQLRCKGGSDQAFLNLALRIREITRDTGTLFIVNDRPDIALASHADGLHLGASDMDPVNAKKIVGSRMIIGLSTHSIEQVRLADAAPVDYIGFGPVFETKTKAKAGGACGTNFLAHAVEISTHPVVAIGGISMGSIEAVAKARPNNAAVSGAICRLGDPYKAITEINRVFLEGI
ncbi:MAG: thiamine phosphate synthase [Thermodesulfobacteriota bacterium]|nr:thiamine phosphate synthase [Thermodesulfobacteriota bacterium]